MSFYPGSAPSQRVKLELPTPSRSFPQGKMFKAGPVKEGLVF